MKAFQGSTICIRLVRMYAYFIGDFGHAIVDFGHAYVDTYAHFFPMTF